MLLYYCETCGHWQDVSLMQGFQKAILDGLFASAPAQQRDALLEANNFDCPNGHGQLVQVKPDDKIMLRPKQSDTVPRLRAVKRERQR